MSLLATVPRWAVVGAAAIGIAGIAGALAATTFAARHDNDRATITPTPAPFALSTPVARMDGPVLDGAAARAELLRAAVALTPDSFDNAGAPYSYTEMWQWTPVHVGADSAAWSTSVVRQQRWRNASGAGRQVRWDQTGGRCRQDGGDTRWSSGMPAPLETVGVSADPAALLAQLVGQTGGQPQDVLAAYADAAAGVYLPLAVRVAALRMLADLPQIVVQHGRDPLTRFGIRVAVQHVDSSGARLRSSIWLDVVTGHVLVHEQAVQQPVAPGSWGVEGMPFYRLHMAMRTAGVDTPPAGCQHNVLSDLPMHGPAHPSDVEEGGSR